jgi:hypothetical protein
MGDSFQILPDQEQFGVNSREWYFLSIREKDKWILEQGGERVLLYKRIFTGSGVLCPLYNKIRHTSQQHGQDNICQGTGSIVAPLTIQDITTGVNFTVTNIPDTTHIVVSSTTGVNPGDTIQQGSYTTTVTTVTDLTNLVIASTEGFTGSGYFAPIEIWVSLLSSGPEQIEVSEFGRKRTYTPRSWTLWEPLITEGDFLVRRNNERLWIQKVTLSRWKHYVLHQSFDTAEVERNHEIYNIPSGL